MGGRWCEMAEYDYKSNLTMLLKSLKASRSTKEKAGWSRGSGSGFIAEEITKISIDPATHILTVETPGMSLSQKSDGYSLRETDEMITWTEKKIATLDFCVAMGVNAVVNDVFNKLKNDPTVDLPIGSKKRIREFNRAGK